VTGFRSRCAILGFLAWRSCESSNDWHVSAYDLIREALLRMMAKKRKTVWYGRIWTVRVV
jgi:hypothetical protein